METFQQFTNRCKTHQVFSLVVGQLDILELTIDNGGSFKLGSWFLNLRSHLVLPAGKEQEMKLQNKS